jgi:hypothetical protein
MIGAAITGCSSSSGSELIISLVIVLGLIGA